MLQRINKVTRSKPAFFRHDIGTAQPSMPGMSRAPSISRDGADYIFNNGSYVGATSFVRSYLLDGANIVGRVSGGRFTPDASDAGKFLVFREQVTGSDGSIRRQASTTVEL